ncbi:hypothetical protein HanXRQr2_Chr01g0025451 [Helianthus annuus]|uniref:Uncharacterized protein n=1 Tax=Helianthus annuus TaxID=4232 RepID=A0A9K3P2I9_HELAN|nr:hypothetical protein HanXRQr2_Chr01g0025451 [Helianthus annuus]
MCASSFCKCCQEYEKFSERKRGSLADSSPKSFNRWALQKGKKVRVVQKARGSLEIGSFV